MSISYQVVVVDGTGNLSVQSIPTQTIIYFTDPKLASLTVVCCDVSGNIFTIPINDISWYYDNPIQILVTDEQSNFSVVSSLRFHINPLVGSWGDYTIKYIPDPIYKLGQLGKNIPFPLYTITTKNQSNLFSYMYRFDGFTSSILQYTDEVYANITENETKATASAERDCKNTAGKFILCWWKTDFTISYDRPTNMITIIHNGRTTVIPRN